MNKAEIIVKFNNHLTIWSKIQNSAVFEIDTTTTVFTATAVLQYSYNYNNSCLLHDAYKIQSKIAKLRRKLILVIYAHDINQKYLQYNSKLSSES